jgi:hypothetical protein
MILYRADKDSMRVERDILNFLARFASPSLENSRDHRKNTDDKIFKITIEVEQVEPPL